MKRKKVTQGNYIESKGKKVKGQSMTLQNETQSIAQILARHIQGEPIKGKEVTNIEDMGHDDVDLEGFQRLDLTEKEDIIAGMRAMTLRIRKMEEEYLEAKKVADIARKKDVEDVLQKQISEGK